MAYDDPVPSISAGCAHCGFVFPLNLMLACPKCSKTGVSWAALTTNAPLDTLEPGAAEEIRWLEEHVANAKEIA